MKIGLRYLLLVLIITLLAILSVKVVLSGPLNRVKVLIRFAAQPGLAEEMQIRQVGGVVRYRYQMVNAIAATLPEMAISHLENNFKITLIEPDLPMHAVDIELDNSWGVSRIGAGVVHSSGNMGQGVNIAIIDSGIDKDHPDLDSNYKGGMNFVDPTLEPLDVYGHGTHVAGTACAEDNGNGIAEGSFGVVGVAPLCNLYALKVLEDNGWGDSGDLIAALEWAVLNGIDVANLSLGWDRYPGEIVEQAFTNAEQMGLVIVAAACNNGKWHGKGENVCYPGKFTSVIAVAATDADDTRAFFSSTGPEVEIAAPGVAVLSTWNSTSSYSTPDPVCHIEEDIVDVCYKYGSGTSMASPHVAGVAALIIASGIDDTNGDGHVNDEVRQILIDTADDLGVVGWDPWYGHGLVNAFEAVAHTAPPEPVTDVAITTLQGPDSAVLGEIVHINVTVANIGTVNTNTFDVYLVDSTYGDVIGTINLIGLDVGESTQLTFDWNTEFTQTGSHFLVAHHTYGDNNTGNDSLNIMVDIIDEMTSELSVEYVYPNQISAKSLETVIVYGTGFAQGAVVSFEDGKGTSPSATTKSVSLAGTEIVIDVVTKQTPKPVIWTMRVTNPDGTSDVLENAITVLP